MIGRRDRAGSLRVMVAASRSQIWTLMLIGAGMFFCGGMLVAYVAVEGVARAMGDPYLALDAHASAGTWLAAFGMMLAAGAVLLALCLQSRPED